MKGSPLPPTEELQLTSTSASPEATPPGLPAFRIEVPSVEHPALLAVLHEEAKALGVPISRISQGGGTQLLRPSELKELVECAHGASIEVYSFVSRRDSFDGSHGIAAGDQIRGERAFADAVEELHECCAAGVDGVLIADPGLLAHAGALQRSGTLGKLGLKSAAAIAPLNAATAALYESIGATSINVSCASSIEDIAAMRQAVSAATTLDIYIESPMDLGGAVRYREARALLEAAAPVFFKIGLRTAGSLYPYGAHLEAFGEATMREKARKARLLLDLLEGGAPDG
jgi:hypothetical protein